jgi:hypothetical protein
MKLKILLTICMMCFLLPVTYAMWETAGAWKQYGFYYNNDFLYLTGQNDVNVKSVSPNFQTNFTMTPTYVCNLTNIPGADSYSPLIADMNGDNISELILTGTNWIKFYDGYCNFSLQDILK